MISKAAKKYFAHYATPLSTTAPIDNKIWDRAVVIPAWRETETLKRCLTTLSQTAIHSRLQTLAIVVLNGAADDRPSRLRLAEELNPTQALSSAWSPFLDLQILFLDRPSVGFARKTGMDFAARLFFEKRLRSAWLRTTDADVEVSLQYLDDSETNDSVSAELFNFIHTYDNLQTDAAEAHCIYDIFLRYYIAGLEFARSPYAFQSLGSIMNVNVDAYIDVRGFPDREAGEDFYLLNKLAKVGNIQTRKDAPLSIEGRLSDRVPFGTGRGVSKILERSRSGLENDFYDPRIFSEVQLWLSLLEKFARDKNLEDLQSRLSPSLQKFFDHEQLLTQISKLPLGSLKSEVRHRQLMHWFDGFRTLKLVHYIRDHIYPSIPWPEALRKADFIRIQGPLDRESLFEVGRQLEPPRVHMNDERRYIRQS